MMDMFFKEDKLKCFHTLEVVSNKNYKIMFPVVICSGRSRKSESEIVFDLMKNSYAVVSKKNIFQLH